MYQEILKAFQRFYTFFRSAKMTLIIIAVLMALFASGLIIPQKTLFQSGAQYDQWKISNPTLSGIIERFHLNEIYIAPVTQFFLVLFFLNLIIVVGHRIPLIIRRAYLFRRDPLPFSLEAIKASSEVRTISVVKDPADDKKGHDISEPLSVSEDRFSQHTVRSAVVEFLKRRFWSIIETKDTRSVLAVKNRYSPLGFLLFHLSFFLCLIGGLLVTYTRFSGNLGLAEGQEFYADITQFRRISKEPKIFKELPAFGIRIEKVTPHYEEGLATDLEVRMKVRYADVEEDAVVRVNEPLKKGPLSILANTINYAPLFILRTDEGTELIGGYFSLSVADGAEDSFAFPSFPYKYFVRLYPDYAVKDGKEYSQSPVLTNPFTHLRIETDDKIVYEGSIAMGQSASFDSLNLTYAETRYWVDFLIVREYGNIPLIAGFLLGGVGLIMRLIFYQKELKIYIEDPGDRWRIFIAGKSEYHRYAFSEELDGLTADIESLLYSFPHMRRAGAGE